MIGAAAPLRHDTCLAPGLIPHALAAAISAAVRNLRLTLNAEFKRRREHQRNRTTRSARRKNRRRHRPERPHNYPGNAVGGWRSRTASLAAPINTLTGSPASLDPPICR